MYLYMFRHIHLLIHICTYTYIWFATYGLHAACWLVVGRASLHCVVLRSGRLDGLLVSCCMGWWLGIESLDLCCSYAWCFGVWFVMWLKLCVPRRWACSKSHPLFLIPKKNIHKATILRRLGCAWVHTVKKNEILQVGKHVKKHRKYVKKKSYDLLVAGWLAGKQT